VPRGQVIADSAPRFTEDGARLLLMTGAAANADPRIRTRRRSPRRSGRSLSYRSRSNRCMRLQQDQNRTTARFTTSATNSLFSSPLPICRPSIRLRRCARWHVRFYVPAEASWDQTYGDVLVDRRRRAPQGARPHRLGRDDVARRQH
jgi:hypothetical protein